MMLDSDASDSDMETLVPSTNTPQVLSTAKRPTSAIVSPKDLHRPGARNVAPKGSYSPRKKLNQRHRGGFSRYFYENKHRSLLTDTNNRSLEHYHVAFSWTKTSNE